MDKYGWATRDWDNYDWDSMSPEELEAYRNMPPGEKLRLAMQVSEAARERMKADIRAENPDFTEEEVFKEFIRRTLPADLVKKVYGWEGYPSDKEDERETCRKLREQLNRTVDK